VKLSFLALSLTVILSGPASAAPLASSEVGRAWACPARTSADGVDVSVVRTIDADGQQRKVSAQWSAAGLDRGRLTLSAVQTVTGAGDPPIRPRELLVSWSGFPRAPRATRQLIVLHRASEPPNPLDGTAMIPYINGLIGAVVSWQRVAALARGSPAAQISLIDPNGRTIRSAPVDLGFFTTLRQRLLQAVEESRRKAVTFRKSCELTDG
jgi:hypothetical protein